MAILSNGKFYGFLCSAKETGQKLANGVKEYVEDFVSGFAGHGWKIWEYVSGKWMLEVDALRVRGQFTVFELLVSKIRAIIGAQAITQGCGKIKTVNVSDDGIAYLITIEDADMSFVEHDFIRCQEFSGGQKLYHVEIESVAEGVIRILKSEFDVDGEGVVMNPPVPGDDIVQFGNSSHDEKYIGRHSAIYMHADEGAQPAIDVLDGIYSKDWSDCLKVRMGGDIPGSNGLKGFYCVNGIIKGIDNGGSVLYQFNPDGSGFIGRGAIKWDAEGFRFGTGVKLAWDNLDDETKENLKGEPGQDGKDGLDGVNGENGKDGLDIVWKGELSTSPANPQKNWVYRNTIDGRVYLYNSISWTLMVADGNDGTEGANGKDGKDVYITYHDSEEEPARPNGNGTTGGWHTNATAAVIWISQKVAEDAESGEWGDPIKVKGNQGEPGKDANLLPWIEEWNGYATEIGGGYIVTPKMFSGTRSADGKLTGIAQGKDCLTEADGKKRTGIFALADNKIMFEMDPENGTYQFKGRIESDEIKINDFSKLSSAVFCGDYMYSQRGVDADGEISDQFQLFDPSTIGESNAPFTPNILFDFNKGSGFLGGGKIVFDSDGTIELNSVSINNSIASGASHFSGESLPPYLAVTSQYVISTLSSAIGGYTYLNVPIKRFGGKLDLKLNQAIDITIINMSSQILSIGIHDTRSGTSKGQFKYFYSTNWRGVWPDSSVVKNVDTVTVPQYYPVELIFIPTGIQAAWYVGTWLIKNSNAYQLYYHPNAADFLKYDLVPVNANQMQTKG